MDKVTELEARLTQALDRIRTRLEGTDDSRQLAAVAAQVEALKAENRQLHERLVAQQAQREKDIAELDTLIAQLKPLVEEEI